jgi:hypothetical protein
MSDAEHLVQRTIAAICQSDPLIKLLEQVRLGRMQRSDPGLRAITDAWLEAYRKALASPGFDRPSLYRIDPAPRVNVLIEEGIVPADHPGVRAVLSEFEQAIARAPV